MKKGQRKKPKTINKTARVHKTHRVSKRVEIETCPFCQAS